jgi:hypothetical protein
MAFKSLSELKKSRGGFENLAKEVEKISKPTFEKAEDTRFWTPAVDKVGNGYAVIRFLPPTAGEDLPWVRIWTHGFKGSSGKWYIENSLTTIGKEDPVSVYNTELWNSGNEADKETARKQKRKLSYIANILVIKDQANPENEGQVKLFKFGKKIFDKIKDITNPQFEDEEPINPFDFWKGANFKLKIRNVDDYRNYDKSEFDKVSQIAETDEEIEAIWNKQYKLQEFLDPKNFKSYEELEKKLKYVLGSSALPQKRAEEVELDEDVVVAQEETKQKPSKEKVTRTDVDFEDEDESLSYFAKLAKDDD